ncbi:MAG: methyltransferase domain-containing protein [Eubacteriales bacterium]|jgi:demethylmenaquinone methyltransferase/2-methoxy-6-polyprenyl-1,4-benzoquinol methylase|nr:methyltransferase domain-containing protein [Bacillota bacterium]MBV1728428.1 methyltransferase domain-containing protein [Desulforudis sp.]MDQ7788915.1 methyltransferase domain-containing protein [Clostridia bacterium]MDZ4042568.1 methyltransferase domain-containing protein [Eubacteriales bacterium]MBU4532235.1 methyltransferase domain-containing protein [Bacillota bacterium]
MRKEFFNNLAAKWDNLVVPDARQKLSAIVTDTGLKEGIRVLDVGCGTGVMTPILLNAVGETGAVTGIDFAGEMVALAEAKNSGPNVRFLEADVDKMPFDTAQFDAVFCNNAFPHFPDKAVALIELRRVLKAGGTLVICHTNSREGVNSMHRQIGGAVGEDMLPSVPEILGMLNRAGFEVTEVIDGPDVFVVRASRAVS